MRWGLLNIIVAVSLVVACAESKKGGDLQPTSLDFGPVYVGDTRAIDLSTLTLNGAPLKDPKFSLGSLGFSSFSVVLGGYLGTTPGLVFQPGSEGEQGETLVVKVEGETFTLHATGRGKAVPTCPEPGLCHQVTFSFAEDRCVVENGPNGKKCGPSDCEGDELCTDGACTYTPRASTPPICKADVPRATVAPAWTYEADPERMLWFWGIVDAEGNLYATDCTPGDRETMRCDIVSLTSDGQRRWRIPASALPAFTFGFDLSIIGGSLFVYGSTEANWRETLAFHLTDGSFAWQRNDFLAIVPAGAGRAAAILAAEGFDHDSTVLVVDTESGAELRRLSNVIHGRSFGDTVSDGQGIIYDYSMYSSNYPPVTETITTAVSLEEGRLWSAARPNESPTATDGTHLFMGGDLVRSTADGRALYADPGISGAVYLNATTQSFFTRLPGAWEPRECRDSNLRRFGLDDGVERSSCRLHEDDVSLQIVTPPLPTHDGGTIFPTVRLASASDPTEKVSLRRVDADGNATWIGLLDGLDSSADVLGSLGAAAIVNGRWVVAGQMQSGRAILAYDVPGLALAEHGWIPNGSQARNNAPW